MCWRLHKSSVGEKIRIILIRELWRATPTEKKNKNVEFERTTVDSFRFTHSTKAKRFIFIFSLSYLMCSFQSYNKHHQAPCAKTYFSSRLSKEHITRTKPSTLCPHNLSVPLCSASIPFPPTHSKTHLTLSWSDKTTDATQPKDSILKEFRPNFPLIRSDMI